MDFLIVGCVYKDGGLWNMERCQVKRDKLAHLHKKWLFQSGWWSQMQITKGQYDVLLWSVSDGIKASLKEWQILTAFEKL